MILACDLGGSSFRAALIDGTGQQRASHALPLVAPLEASGRSEIDPAIWWQAFRECATALALAQPTLWLKVRAIAISAFTRSQVLVDASGAVLRPAILWRDTRSGGLAARLAADSSPGHPELANLNAFHPLARLLWLRTVEPEVYARLRHVLEPKDWLNFRLTGRMAGDPVSMARLAAAAQPVPDGPNLFEAAGIDPSVIPPLLPPVSIMGHVQPELASPLASLAGVPVITMANDTFASVVGLGALRPGYAYNLSGTTEVFGLVTGTSAAAEGLLTVDWSGGQTGSRWQLGGPSQTGGDTIIWLLELMSGEAVDAKAAGATLATLLAGRRAPDPVLFLPFLQGERVPFWDASLRGSCIGLGRHHGPTDLAFAVLEGIACLNRLVLQRAEAATGVTASEIRFGGGGAANAVWRQIKADILGRPVVSVPGEEHGLAGAAIMALTATGGFADLDAAQAALVPAGQRHVPAESARARSDRLYQLFVRACEAINPLARQLSGWG